MMIKVALFVSLCYAQVAINQAQMNLMMKALGVEMPMMPTMPTMPKMPASLKAAITAPQRRLQEQKRLQQQRMARMRAIQIRRLREDAKKNPYSRVGIPRQPSQQARLQARHSQQARQQARQPSQQARQHRQHTYYRRTYRKTPYSSAFRTSQRPQNSVYSPANSVRRPSSQQLMGVKPPANPYSVQRNTQSRVNKPSNPYSVQARATPKPSGNPYSTSRAVSSNVPGVRNKAMMERNALQLRRQRMHHMAMQSRFRMKSAMKGSKMVTMAKKIMDQPKKQAEAMGAGCLNPETPMASMMRFQTCKSAAIRMMCTMDMKSCVNVGIGAMCCPHGVNRLTMDTMNYMKKMQKFMQQLEGFMK